MLKGGKAVRFDDASVAKPREIQMCAANFKAIIRAATPPARAELMHAYEGFSYRAGHVPFAEGHGDGLRLALFFTRSYNQVIRPGLGDISSPWPTQARLQQAVNTIDQEIARLCEKLYSKTIKKAA